jgi:hypothetical protein
MAGNGAGGMGGGTIGWSLAKSAKMAAKVWSAAMAGGGNRLVTVTALGASKAAVRSWAQRWMFSRGEGTGMAMLVGIHARVSVMQSARVFLA